MSILHEDLTAEEDQVGHRRFPQVFSIVSPNGYSQTTNSVGTHRAISLVAVIGLFWPMFKAWNTIVAVPSGGIAVVALTAGGLWLIAAIATANDEPAVARLDRYLLALALLVLTAWAASELHQQASYGTDEAAFEQGAATLLLHGHDPYGANLAGTLSEFGLLTKYATYTMSGGMASTFGYPAFPLLIAAPFVKLTGGGQAVPIADVLVLMVATVTMFKQLPIPWRGLAIVVCVAFPILTTFALSGLNAIIAMATLLFVAHRWTNTGETGRLTRRDRLQAMAFGLALATNQIAWFVGPFLLCGIYVVRRSQLGGRVARKLLGGYAGIALLVFAAVNLPFFLWGPSAWLHGVAAPLLQHAIPYGQGLIDLTLFLHIGGGAIDAYNYAAGCLYIALLIVYIARFPRLGQALFVLPLAALFVSGRSLAGYWMTLIAVIVVGTLTADQETIRSVRTVGAGRRLPRPLRTTSLVAPFLPAAICLAIALATPQPLTMRIIGAQSSQLLHSVRELQVSVENRSDQPLRPHFATNVSGQAVMWNIAAGPAVLVPGRRGTYRLRLSDAASMPPNGAPFVLEAFTASPRTISSSAAFTQRGQVPGYW